MPYSRNDIEIGGGPNFHHGWAEPGRYVWNLDPYYGEGPWRKPAQELPWPAVDDSITRVRASHVLEHIPAGEPRINVFNEAHRVLIPGGIFAIDVPRFPHDAAVSDPTHVSFFVPDSFIYFTAPSVSGPSWEVWYLAEITANSATIHCELRKP